jgi:H-type lectin domain
LLKFPSGELVDQAKVISTLLSISNPLCTIKIMAQTTPQSFETHRKLGEFHMCYQKVPSNVKGFQLPPGNLAAPLSNLSGPAKLALGRSLYWKIGQHIKVSWWSGEKVAISDHLKQRVAHAAKQWEQHANLKLDFGLHGDEAHIRIAFEYQPGLCWSHSGTDNLTVPKTEPTMNLGWINNDSDDLQIQSVVLHQFGHALGLIHEHHNPEKAIKWNEPLVLGYFRETYKLEDGEIRSHILYTDQPQHNIISDPQSIMLYSYPDSLTLDHAGVPGNSKLSLSDVSLIKRIYPPSGHDVGHFETKELITNTAAESTQGIGPISANQVVFDTPFDLPPQIAIGLSHINMKCKANKIISVHVDEIINEYAIVSVNTWEKGILKGGGANWVEAKQNSQDWQFGEFNTQEIRDRNYKSSNMAVHKLIYFDNVYDEPPEVLTFLKLVDIDNGHDYGVKTYATAIHRDHFALHIHALGDSVVHAAAASWVAWPKGTRNALGTSITTKQDHAKNSGRWEFPAGTFGKKPEVRIFLSSIHLKHGADLRIKARVEGATKEGVDWHVDTWDDSHLNQAEVALLAWL